MRKLACVVAAALLLVLSGCILFLAGEEVLYEETFSAPAAGVWTLGSTEAADKWIDNGKYYMLVKSNVYSFGYNQVDGPFTDVQIDLDVNHILGTPNLSGSGIIFRVTDFSNLYAFVVSPTGTFTVLKWVGGTRTTLLSWADSTAIRQGVAGNHLTVIAKGASLSFFINGTEVAMLTDASLPTGRVGVVALALDAEVDVLEGFDNLVVQAAAD